MSNGAQMTDIKAHPRTGEECAAILAGMYGIGDEQKDQMYSVDLTPEDLLAMNKQLATMISRDYEGKKLLVVGLLKGCFMFLSDVMRHVTVPYDLDFISVSSYEGQHSSGNIRLKKDLDRDPAGWHVLVIEDLIDTGRTLNWIKNYLSKTAVLSVKIAVLLDKQSRRKEEFKSVTMDYVGCICPDSFVVGYGMDYNGLYRCLPFVGVLKPSVVRSYTYMLDNMC
jgi:hypoxanthine phosphoribosyltransferase